jgi:hypothetical protein
VIPASLAAVLERIEALQARFGTEWGPAPGSASRFEAVLRDALEAPAGGEGAPAGPSPAAPAAMRALVERVAREEGVDPALAVAVMDAESGGNPRAVSGAGALGLMQLMPATAREMGVGDPFDPEENARAGIRYLREKLREFGGSVPLALAAYNAGSGAVWQHGGVPPYPETQAFVGRVLAEAGALARRETVTQAADAGPAPGAVLPAGPGARTPEGAVSAVRPFPGGVAAPQPGPGGAAQRSGARVAGGGQGAAGIDAPSSRPVTEARPRSPLSSGERRPDGVRGDGAAGADAPPSRLAQEARSGDAPSEGERRPDAVRSGGASRETPPAESREMKGAAVAGPGRPARDGAAGPASSQTMPGDVSPGDVGEHSVRLVEARPDAAPSVAQARDGVARGERMTEDVPSAAQPVVGGSQFSSHTGSGGSGAREAGGDPRGDAAPAQLQDVIPRPAQAQSARVVVRPPGLPGPVSISVSGSSGEISARISAPSPSAAELLLRGEDALRGALAAHRIALGSLAVAPVGSEQGAGHERGRGARWGSQPDRAWSIAYPDFAEAREEGSP